MSVVLPTRRRDSRFKPNTRKNCDTKLLWGIVVVMLFWSQNLLTINKLPNLVGSLKNTALMNSLREKAEEMLKVKIINETMKANAAESAMDHHELLRKSPANDPETHGLFHNYDPLYGFVLINGYRMDTLRFAAVGLGALSLRNIVKIETCHWVPVNGSAVEGKVSVFRPGEHHDLKYETVILICTLPEVADYEIGGKMLISMDGTQMLAYTETQDYKTMEKINRDFPYRVAYCSPPIYGTVENARIEEWIKYHMTLDFNYMVMYDAGGVDSELKKVFEPYIREGLMELIDVKKTLRYETWLYSQVALMNDCAYRMRYHAKWVMFMDFDEYWNSDYQDLRLGNVLDNFKGKPYVTFGSLWWSADLCYEDNDASKWPIERMVFHWPVYYCVYKEKYPEFELCLDYYGHRKYAVNPRLITSLIIHRPEIPQTGGVDLDAKIARMNHFQGLIKRNATLCKTIVTKDKIEWWSKGNEISNLANKVRLGTYLASN